MIVETGAVIPDADSYVSVAEADAYFTSRGIDAWAGATSVKESALVRATDYVEQTYDGRWKGERVSSDQSLSWPRYDVCVDGYYIPMAAIPKQLVRAVCELAVKALSSDLNPDIDKGGVKFEKVDVIETEYFENGPLNTKRPAVDGNLRGLLISNGVNAKVVRV
ncbi:MAG: hypothetical protein DI551_05700 [Micavibrio aeruginosavorus]|uniref:Putative DnaT-like domain-containing protein n=1 Tax=Micavibrio aeruginosavorus TaxID=349221 RepID=A0A2W5PUQ5_9BACT|nr:MAG: hypothetical protein DI551_05700 [Micavibrio aeruginosavorus]